MSSIVTLETPGSTFDTTIVGENLEIVAQQGEENIIEAKGDSPITIFGGSLADDITTGAGDASVFGGDGNDSIMGGIGDDIIQGGEGADIINSGIGADFVFGGAGSDTIRGGLPGGSDNNPMGDVLSGGDGADVFEFAKGEFDSGAVDQIVDFQADGFADFIRIFGVTEGGVSYNPETGLVSINGKEAIDIGTGLDIDVKKEGGDSNTWELF
ncbi:MAG: hypothetical protein AAGF83_04095 [Cyanobacteria bacterium P01_G01_bin.67]